MAKAASGRNSWACLERLARLYWYTVEFGLVEEAGEVCASFGAGILSSFTETRFALESRNRPIASGFDLKRVLSTHYRIDEFQEAYFVLTNLDTLLDMAKTDFGPVYAELEGQPEFAPATVLDGPIASSTAGAANITRR